MGASLVTLVVQWVDVTQLEKNATLLFPECIKVSTRDSELYFSMFLNINETFKLMEQLANIAMRQLLDNEGFLEDKSLPKPSKPLKNISALKRYVSLPAVGMGNEEREQENQRLGLCYLVILIFFSIQRSQSESRLDYSRCYIISESSLLITMLIFVLAEYNSSIF